MQGLIALDGAKNRGSMRFRGNRQLRFVHPTCGLGFASRCGDVQLAPRGQVSGLLGRLRKHQGRNPGARVAVQASERRIKKTAEVSVIFVDSEILGPAFANLLHPTAHEQGGRSRQPG